ncbi:MAG TPA: flagellar assembly protein T N-terminal domain-containing protein [Acidobacteriota bacterium]|nr:flagellar assembly protein T N-terminal domain-containing protein [Acidobacteriota bacterium]
MTKGLPILVLLLCFALPVFAQDTKQITAEGVASIGSDPAAARDKAIDDALRRAVEQAVGSMVESETAVENYKLLSDRIYSRSSGYVKNYNVISERQEGGLLRVTISADVSSGDLNNDLAGIGLLQRRMKYPRVMVSIIEDNILTTSDYWNTYSVSTSQAESTVNMKMKEKGFNIVDPNFMRKQMNAREAKEAWEGDYATAGNFGKRLGAEIVIIGQATSTRAANTIMGSDLISVSSAINATAVKAGTGEVIAQATGKGTAAHINEVAAMQESLKKASDQVSEQLITGILDQWQRESSGTRAIAMVVNDISPAELDRLKAGVEKLRGVAEVQVRNFSQGSADITIQAKTDGQELSALIGKTSFNGFKLILVDSSVDHLEYNVVH